MKLSEWVIVTLILILCMQLNLLQQLGPHFYYDYKIAKQVRKSSPDPSGLCYMLTIKGIPLVGSMVLGYLDHMTYILALNSLALIN